MTFDEKQVLQGIIVGVCVHLAGEWHSKSDREAAQVLLDHLCERGFDLGGFLSYVAQMPRPAGPTGKFLAMVAVGDREGHAYYPPTPVRLRHEVIWGEGDTPRGLLGFHVPRADTDFVMGLFPKWRPRNG